MKKQATTPRQERQLKLAEAGILFVLILGLTVFLGVRIFSGDETPAPVAVNQSPAAEQTVGTVEPLPIDESIATAEVEVAEAETVPEIVEPRTPVVVTYALCEQAYRDGDYAGAAELFGVYTQEHPANAWGHYMAGLSSWKAGDDEGAEEAFTAALAIQPDHLKSRINFGRVLLEMDRAEEAREQLEAAVAIDSQSVDAQRVLARAYHNLGRLDEAVISYRAALARSADDAWSLNNLGLIYIEQERFAEALPALAKAAELKGEQACIQNNLGVALERSGYFQHAAAAYERALEADAKYAKAELSLERVGERADAAVDEQLDLAALAASFTVTAPVVARAEEMSSELVEIQEDEFGIGAAGTEPAADSAETTEPLEVAQGEGSDGGND